MTNQVHGLPHLYALLIGIDCYLPNVLPDGSHYPSLGGCVRDIAHVEKFLQKKLGLTSEQIFKLTASNTGTIRPPEPEDCWPTYKNMVAAFRKLTEVTQQGDQLYIHYSGHGGRTPTLLPELKGANGLDEALVPLDIGNSTARYLRDNELAYILKSMVDRGLIVTIVLDSCHSGGATRGKGGASVRGVSAIDTTQRPAQSLIVSHEMLAETWRSLSKGTQRNFTLGSGWLPEPEGYVLLAACRPSESAYEYSFDGKGTNGALTYWLLDSLKQIGSGFTYKHLHDHVVTRIHSQFEQQTPQLEGESSRLVFGSEHIQSQHAINVMKVDTANQRVLVNTGQAQGVHKGAQFAVYPPGTRDFTQVNQRLALVEITEPGATDSWARMVKRFRSEPVKQASQAVLVDPGIIRLRRRVCLLRQSNLLSLIDQGKALEAVEMALDQNSFLEIAVGEAPADYQVIINSEGEYEIWDPGGKAITHLLPALRVDDDKAPDQLVRRLVHLTKYRNIQLLDNGDPLSPLAGKLLVKLAGVQSEYDPMHRPEPRPFDDLSNTLRPGEWTFLHVKNASSRVLNVTVLDLAPDWSINQIYPSDHDNYYMPFDPGQEMMFPLQAYLPDGYTDATDILKVFATVGSTNFRWLELEPLDHPPQRRGTRGGPTNALEELLVALTVEIPKTRHLNPATYPTREWATAQVEVRVQQI